MFVRVDEARAGRRIVAETLEQRGELGPSRLLTRQVPWRLRQDLPQHGRENQRKAAADQEERAPSIGWNDERAGEASERAAQRNADDRERDTLRSTAERDVFG